MKKWLFLVGAILSESAGSLSLKAALGHPVWYLLVIAGFLAAFVFLALVLREGMALGVAYGIWGCLLYTSPSPRDLSTSRMPSSA